MACRFDAVFLDFYGTLSAGDRAAVLAACAKVVETFNLDVTPDQFAQTWGKRFFRVIDQSNGDRFQTLHECERVSLQATLQDDCGEIDPKPFVAILKAYWQRPQIHDDALELLNRLDLLDLPVVCVSNADTSDIESAIRLHGLRFDALVTSEIVRSYKPDARIFQYAAEKIGVDLTRVMHVGDSLHSDIDGAKRLGMTATWISREERIFDVGQAEPDYTIRTLRELPALL